ncbi:GumC family protein [Aurantiacibacter sp. D1-12]|uniref:GumC family protein n=1 Tax=Aurantiacibacter sp. D1-12 TaxID=2993658 RepID=UPI00237C5AF4|nr:polysaccharide biosynthesis tyrosine autokinase [Aurantiacibacter sp. D1-12]MDE1467464.1 polysaccharide biosynthesis tyrosine autokinase [Aurantiacibacter sp. D1-12]
MNSLTEHPADTDPDFDPYWDAPKAAPRGNPYGRGGLINFGAIRAMLWRQRWILAGTIVLALVFAVIFTLLMTPIYAATSAVRVDPQATQLIEGQEIVDPYIGANEIDRYLQTLTHELTSRAMAEKVEESLDLANNAAFLGFEDEAALTSGFSANEAVREGMAADKLQGSLEVEVPLLTSVINITVKSTDPELAAAIANAYAENFLSSDVERALEANSYALEFLDNQIAELRDELQAAERQAIDYARANRLVGEPLQAESGAQGSEAGSGTPNTLAAANLREVNQRFIAARAARIAAEQRWRNVSNTPPAELPEVQASAHVQELRTQLAQAEAQLRQLRNRYRDDYPEVQQLLVQIETMQRNVALAGAEIKSAIRDEYDVARGQEQALAAELARLSDVTLDEQDRRVQFNLLDREVVALRSQLESLLSRYNQIASAANLQSSNATLLDRAVVPGGPVSPNLFQNLIIALVLATGLAIALAILREVLDDRMRSTDDVERVLGLRALGLTPSVQEAEIKDDIVDTFSHLSESYASIRATLDFRLAKDNLKIIQFTSSQAGEGKTTTAIALARRYAMLDRKVLLIDADMRRPSVSRNLTGDRPAKGLIEVLMGEASLADVLLQTGVEGLDVVGLARLPNEPVELLSSGVLPDFLEEQRAIYDVILLDSSPVMGIADAPLLARAVDATVFVVEANRAHNGQAKAAVQRLREVGGNVVGAVLTKFRALEAAGDYSYAYQYYTYDQRPS